MGSDFKYAFGQPTRLDLALTAAPSRRWYKDSHFEMRENHAPDTVCTRTSLYMVHLG
jgi:hypothetical protein